MIGFDQRGYPGCAGCMEKFKICRYLPDLSSAWLDILSVGSCYPCGTEMDLIGKMRGAAIA